ncbi:MAG: histidine phosphatase family protein [Myxococcales bacterium]
MIGFEHSTASLTTRVILVRHGHTRANMQGSDVPMSGATDVPLASAGIREAHELAEHLLHESPCTADLLESAPSCARHGPYRCASRTPRSTIGTAFRDELRNELPHVSYQRLKLTLLPS